MAKLHAHEAMPIHRLCSYYQIQLYSKQYRIMTGLAIVMGLHKFCFLVQMDIEYLLVPYGIAQPHFNLKHGNLFGIPSLLQLTCYFPQPHLFSLHYSHSDAPHMFA